MTTTPHGMGQTAALYSAVGTLCAIFKAHPELHAKSITISESGRVEVSAEGTNGVLKDWTRAIPDHKVRPGVRATFYGSDEADVIEGQGITVTVSRPLLGPGGVR